jgi:methionyl-tRNA synthetase
VRVFVGVSWPYANGPFHLGQLASTYLPADLFARFHRLLGDEVLMVSGSDMHGTPILVAAEKAGVTPVELSEKNHELNRAAFERLGITFDLFTTTRTAEHERTAQEVFLALLERGFIVRRTTEQPYCPKHRRFLADRYLVGTCPHCGSTGARGDECDRCGRPLEAKELLDPRCALCGTPARFEPTEHFFLELDRLQPRIAEFLASREGWRPGTMRVAENFLAEGLHPTPITRDLDWGVPIPLEGYDAKRFYVWFEAVTGYVSASREWAIRTGHPDAWRRFWDETEPARHYYFVGKDNKFQHTIVWPGMLLGVGGLHVPDDVPANEWMLIGGGKISKSRSTEEEAFHPSLLARLPPDVIRFYAALLAPENHDTELDWDEVEKLREEVLANQLGNLVQRTLVLARDRGGGRIPSPPDAPGSAGPPATRDEIAHAHEAITELYRGVRLKAALDRTLEEVRSANRRFHEARPWQATPAERERAVYDSIWRIQAISVWLHPVLPFAAAEIDRMLGYAGPLPAGGWARALEPPPPGQVLGEIRPLFPKATKGPAAEERPGPSEGSSGPVPLGARAAVVRAASDHPAAEKLLVLELDVGEASSRTVVAGLRPHYPPASLVGRSIVYLANLEPRTIRKMTSQGMLLAAEGADRPVPLTVPDRIAPGTYVDGRGPGDRTISHAEFTSVPLVVGRVTGQSPPGGSRVDLGDRSVAVDGSWKAGELVVVRLDAPGSERGVVLAFGPGRPVTTSGPVPPGAKIR